MSEKCKFISQSGESCSENDLGSGYCFWHDPHVDKSGMNLADRLENVIHAGREIKTGNSSAPQTAKSSLHEEAEDSRSLAEMELLKALRSIK